MKQVQIRVFGKVQGVFFRANTQKVAEELQLKGIVRNESDGSVYIEAEGSAEAISRLVEWCKVGPRASKVERVEVKEFSESKGYKKFQVEK